MDELLLFLIVVVLEYSFSHGNVKLSKEVSQNVVYESQGGSLIRSTKAPDEREPEVEVKLLHPNLLFLMNRDCLFA